MVLLAEPAAHPLRSVPENSSEDIFALTSSSGQGVVPGYHRAGSVVKILEAYALLLVNNKKLIRSSLDFLDAHVDDLNKQDLTVSLPKSLNTLMVSCPASLREAILAARDISKLELDESQLDEINLLEQSHSARIAVS
jgi:hypothetical protein